MDAAAGICNDAPAGRARREPHVLAASVWNSLEIAKLLIGGMVGSAAPTGDI